jgi:hypothetical protein
LNRAAGVKALAWIAASAIVASAIASGCGQSSTGDCTDKATCPDDAGDGSLPGNDAPSGQDAMGGGDAAADAMPDGFVNDVSLDTIVLPDGPVDVVDGCSAGEDCTNGIDDNCNGMTDCADPLCQSGYTCFDPIPSGWTGLVSLYDATGNPPPAPPACGGGYPNDVVDKSGSPNIPSASCGCTCGSPTAIQCQFVNAMLYSDPGCVTQCASDGLPPNFCVASGCATAQSYIATASPTGGSCSPMPTSNIPPVTFSGVGRACEYAGPLGGGCGAGKCAAKPPTGYGPRCVFNNGGDLPCPSGNYSVKHTYYSGSTDTRACSACSCGAPTGASCTGGQVTLYGNVSCNGASNTYPLSTGCASLPSVPGIGIEATATTPTGGSCGSMGGALTGSAQATGATTVCCMP